MLLPMTKMHPSYHGDDGKQQWAKSEAWFGKWIDAVTSGKDELPIAMMCAHLHHQLQTPFLPQTPATAMTCAHQLQTPPSFPIPRPPYYHARTTVWSCCKNSAWLIS